MLLCRSETWLFVELKGARIIDLLETFFSSLLMVVFRSSSVKQSAASSSSSFLWILLASLYVNSFRICCFSCSLNIDRDLSMSLNQSCFKILDTGSRLFRILF